MEINFITHNPGKIKEVKLILEPEIKVNHIESEYDEIKGDGPQEIAEEAAERLANELGKPIVVDDSGLFITALKDFPGSDCFSKNKISRILDGWLSISYR